MHNRYPSIPRAILFDWDNTLADTWPTIHSCLEKTFRKMGHTPLSLAEVKAGKLGIHRALRASFPEIFGADQWEEARDCYYQHFRQVHLEQALLLDGAKEMLSFLRAQSPLFIGIVSNKTGAFLREEVAHLGVAHFFDGILGALDVAREKPHKDPIIHLLRQAGLDEAEITPETAWLVGDSETDVQAAHNAGIRVVRFGTHHPENTPDFMASDHHALLAHLQQVFTQPKN